MTLNPSDLLARLEGDGFQLETDGFQLKVQPASRLTPELRAAIKDSKHELLRLLIPKPSRVWAEAIAKAQELDPGRCYLVRVAWPDDVTWGLSRLSQPGQLVEALEALSKRFPLAGGVMVCPSSRLIPLFVIGDPEGFIIHPKVKP